MKISQHLPLLIALLTAFVRPAAAEENSAEVMIAKPRAMVTERITDDQLRKLQSEARLQAATQKPTGSEPVAKEAAGSRSFEETSDFIVFNGLSTFVPKGAIIHVPERFRGCIVPAPVGELVPWKEFLVRNRAWIGSLEVTLEEASGVPINPSRMKSALLSQSVIVAVIRGNPTSIAKQQASNRL